MYCIRPDVEHTERPVPQYRANPVCTCSIHRVLMKNGSFPINNELCKLGIAMQAASQNQLAAYYMGIPVKRLNGIAWGLAAAVAAIAGLLLAPITFVHANMGFIGLKAFPAAVVGGFGSLPGAIVGGLVIGVVESFSGFYLPDGFKDTAAYVMVLIMLMVKPNGLFGDNLRKKV